MTATRQLSETQRNLVRVLNNRWRAQALQLAERFDVSQRDLIGDWALRRAMQFCEETDPAVTLDAVVSLIQESMERAIVEFRDECRRGIKPAGAATP